MTEFQDRTPFQESNLGEDAGGRILQLDLVRALQVYRRVVLLCSLLGFLAAIAAGWRLWPIYKAQSQVYIQPAAPKVLEQNGSSRWGSDANSYESFIQQQVQSVTQPAVLLDAIHRMGKGVWERDSESLPAAADRLGKLTKAERVGGSYQVTITTRAGDPDKAAQAANALAAALVENVSKQEKAGNPERIAMLQEERDRIQKELDADRAEQDALSRQLGMVAVNGEVSSAYDHETNALREELVRARAQHDQAAAKLSSLSSRDGATRSLDAVAEDVVSSDAGLNSMKATLDQRRAQLVSQMANLTPGNPQYKQDAAELAQMDASLEIAQKEMRRQVGARIQQKLRSELESTAQVEQRLNAQLAKLAGTAVSATPKMQRASDLATDITRLQTRFTAIDDQLHNMLLENSAPGAAFLSTPATPPAHPTYGPILKRSLPLALGGIFLGLMMAVLLHRLDGRIYVAGDIERLLGFGPMAQLPELSEVSTAVADEHFFRLSAALEHAHQTGNLRSCIFTGTGPGVGVTTIASHVKATLSTMGRATMMVDTSGTPPPPQVESAEEGESLSLALQRGTRSSALLQKFAEEKETREQDLILTDTAPLMISAETEYLARFVDAVIVVLESGVTTRAQLRAVANTLQRLEVKSVGFVLNRIRLSKADPVFRQAVMDMDRRQKVQAKAQLRERHLDFAGTLPGRTAVAASPKPEGKSITPLVTERELPPIPPGVEAREREEKPAPVRSEYMDLPFAPAPEPEAEPEQANAEFTSAATVAEAGEPKTLPGKSRAKSEREELAWRYQQALDEQIWASPVDSSAPVAPAVPLNQTPMREQKMAYAPIPAVEKSEAGPVAEVAQSPLQNPVLLSFTRFMEPVEEVRQAAPMVPPPTSSERLEGLRNLAATAEFGNLRRPTENVAPPSLPTARPMAEAEFWPPEPVTERAATRAENTKSKMQDAEWIASVAPEPEEEKEIGREWTASEVTPWQAEDEIQILPSKRGQYRKRRR